METIDDLKAIKQTAIKRTLEMLEAIRVVLGDTELTLNNCDSDEFSLLASCMIIKYLYEFVCEEGGLHQAMQKEFKNMKKELKSSQKETH